MERSTKTKALVLSGGGVAGIAWEIGLLKGLADGGVDVRNADVVIGTSAGSAVGSQLTSSVPLDEFYANQLRPAAESPEMQVDFDPEVLQAAFINIMQTTPPDPKLIRQRIGQYALSANTASEEERFAVIDARLPIKDWPQQRLLITAVNAEDGEFRVFDRESGVPMPLAVAASCAVPGVWPAVTIQGHRYMDGGMRTGTNADLAKGYDLVLIINPLPAAPDAPYNPLRGEVALLEKNNSKVLVIEASDAAKEAMGVNILDPASAAPSARAGLQQGAGLVAALREFWLQS